MLNVDAILIQLFDEPNEPYTLVEIASRAAYLYGDSISYDRVHYAWSGLKRSPHTARLVQPLAQDEQSHEFLFDRVAARRIVRKIVSGQTPEKFKEKPARKKKAPKKLAPVHSALEIPLIEPLAAKSLEHVEHKKGAQV